MAETTYLRSMLLVGLASYALIIALSGTIAQLINHRHPGVSGIFLGNLKIGKCSMWDEKTIVEAIRQVREDWS